eukprot:scaffold551_cov395-Prasinococcus_capsulatus_cf.AAC.14
MWFATLDTEERGCRCSRCESNLAELIEEQGAVFVRHFFAEGSSGNSGRSNLASLQFGQNLSPECMRLLADVVSGLAHLHSMGTYGSEGETEVPRLSVAAYRCRASRPKATECASHQKWSSEIG